MIGANSFHTSLKMRQEDWYDQRPLVDRQKLLTQACPDAVGRSSIQMTFDVYGHWLEQEDEGERFAAAELSVVG
jgi:hypothetical protein